MSPVSLDANKCDSLPTSRSKCIRNTKELSGVLSENTVSAGLELTAWLEPPPTVLAAVVLPVDLVVVVGVLIKIARERIDSIREIYPIAKVEGRCGMNKSITCSRGKVKFEELSQVPRKIYKLQLFSSSFVEKDTVHLQIRSSWQ
ncbi:hypothetical protein V1477_011971 [Vespula maculifrons]|uniref:Uncharacterized protein n=1 Tax=Vespula maculifrons TaxID=7453 RepID=A0ABD2C0P5_VESMC